MRLLIAASAFLACSAAAQPPAPQPDILQTRQTGTMRSTGLDDPRYLMSFLPAQQLVLRVTREGQVSAADAERALAGLPYRLRHLEETGVLKRVGDHYRLAHMVLTVGDQRKIYDVGKGYGASLARAFISAAPRYRAIFARYRNAEVRADLAFISVAGQTLNWDGLRIGTELGMRARPISKPNGDHYILYSKEVGPRLETSGLYWGSHNSSPGRVRLSTIGDPPSQPRLGGLPDIYFGAGLGTAAYLGKQPGLLGAVAERLQAMTDRLLLLDGAIMMALADGPKSAAELQRMTAASEADIAQATAVLEASSYIEKRDDIYFAKVLVLTERDRPVLDESRNLGREILTSWLKANYPKIRTDLAELDTSKAGVDFTHTFSEVWHYIFGFATKELAERGFYTNPRAPGRLHAGFVPVIYRGDLMRTAGEE